LRAKGRAAANVLEVAMPALAPWENRTPPTASATWSHHPAQKAPLALGHRHIGDLILIELFERDYKRVGARRIDANASLGAP